MWHAILLYSSGSTKPQDRQKGYGREEPKSRKLVTPLWHQRELINEDAWLSEDSNSFLNNLQAKMPNIIHLFLDPTRFHLLHSDFLLFLISKKQSTTCPLWITNLVVCLGIWLIQLTLFHVLLWHAPFSCTGLFPMEIGESKHSPLRAEV